MLLSQRERRLQVNRLTHEIAQWDQTQRSKSTYHGLVKTLDRLLFHFPDLATVVEIWLATHYDDERNGKTNKTAALCFSFFSPLDKIHLALPKGYQIGFPRGSQTPYLSKHFSDEIMFLGFDKTPSESWKQRYHQSWPLFEKLKRLYEERPDFFHRVQSITEEYYSWPVYEIKTAIECWLLACRFRSSCHLFLQLPRDLVRWIAQEHLWSIPVTPPWKRETRISN